MINNLNLQRLQTAAGYSPMAKDTYTTLPEKVMEYLESTMETFILTVWFVWNSFAPPETSIVTLTCSALGEKGNLQCPKFKIYNRLCGCVSFFYTSQISHNFQYTHPYIVNLRNFVFIQ